MDVVIKMRDSIANVAAEILTANSSVFSNLINDLGLKEIEIEDFDPDTVRVFLTLIEGTEIVHIIQRQHFRELHKLSVVFDVKWLTRHCRGWLSDRIENIDYDTTFGICLFILHESLYIQQKWKIEDFTELLIEKREKYDFSHLIYEQLADFDSGIHEKEELDIFLKLCAGTTHFLLRALIERAAKEQALSDNTKYLLENINLALCFEQNRALYHELFDAISSIPNLTNANLKLILKLSTESTKNSFSRQQLVPKTMLCDMLALEEREDTYETLDDALQIVRSGEVLNMFGVLDLLVKVTALHPPEFEEAKTFVDSLEEHFKDKPSRKASKGYVDIMLSAMTSSNHEHKFQGVMLIEMIRDSEKLVSKHDHLCFSYELPVVTDLMKSPVVKFIQYCIRQTPIPTLIGTALSNKIILFFRLKKLGFFDCKESGECGIAVKLVHQKGMYSKLELSTEDADYQASGYRFHNLLSAEKMHFYYKVSGPTSDGIQFTVANQLMGRWSKWWFTNNSYKSFLGDSIKEMCIECNVKDYLVAL